MVDLEDRIILFNKSRKGFTLIELLIVITITVVILALGAGSFLQMVSTQKFTADVKKLESLLNTARVMAGTKVPCPGNSDAKEYSVNISMINPNSPYVAQLMCIPVSGASRLITTLRLDTNTQINANNIVYFSALNPGVNNASYPNYSTTRTSAGNLTLSSRIINTLQKSILINNYGVASVQ